MYNKMRLGYAGRRYGNIALLGGTLNNSTRLKDNGQDLLTSSDPKFHQRSLESLEHGTVSTRIRRIGNLESEARRNDKCAA